MKTVRKKIFFLPVTLRTATFFDKALFCFRVKQILENLAYKQKDFSEQRKKHWTHETAYISLSVFFKRYNSHKPPTPYTLIRRARTFHD